MWIDSDIVFTQKQFIELLDMNKDIASGWYAQPDLSEDGSNLTPITLEANDEEFKQLGQYKIMTAKQIENKTKPFRS